MAVRIQLASNFQVVELTYDKWSEVDGKEVEFATQMVNDLGQKVVNEIKKPAQKKVEMATEGQVKFLVNLGMTEKEARKMTKNDAWHYIHDNK